MKVYVALGSNLGDRLALLRRAAAELESLSLTPLRKSAIYENPAVDSPPGSPPFLNAVVEMSVPDDTSPRDLLERLQSMEQTLGRRPKQTLNEPRPVDLDLICCGELRENAPDLVLPHPRAHLRRFVLQPLCDVAPDLVLPGRDRPVRALLAALPPQADMRRLSVDW